MKNTAQNTERPTVTECKRTFTCFTGTLLGITNMVGTIPGFVGPTVLGVLTNDNVNSHYLMIDILFKNKIIS